MTALDVAESWAKWQIPAGCRATVLRRDGRSTYSVVATGGGETYFARFEPGDDPVHTAARLEMLGVLLSRATIADPEVRVTVGRAGLRFVLAIAAAARKTKGSL